MSALLSGVLRPYLSLTFSQSGHDAVRIVRVVVVEFTGRVHVANVVAVVGVHGTEPPIAGALFSATVNLGIIKTSRRPVPLII